MVLRGSNINPKKDHKSFMSRIIAGGTAGAVARTCVAPIDRVKIMLQTSTMKGKQVNTFKESIRLIKNEGGIRSFWKGNGTNCSRVIPHTATQFTAYNFFKENLATDTNNISISERLGSGALAGATAATITHPLDVVRIRLQTENNVHTVNQAIKHILKEGKGNPLQFYKGYGPTIVSLGPFIGINFASFDIISTYFKPVESKVLNGLIIGGISGFVAQTFCYPLDTLRRRSQVSGTNYSSWYHACLSIFQKEGPSGFYKGFSANALKVIPNNGIRFGVFELVKNFFF